MYAPVTPFPMTPPLETPDGWRGQELHSKSAFASLGQGPFEIAGFAWRPDVSVNAPVSTEWEFTLYASTTTKEGESLSTTFADNYGPDGATQVFAGTVPLETDGVPEDGGLHSFDYVFKFDTPYVYNPMEGNLLFEYVSPDNLADVWVWADGEDQINWSSFGLSASAQESLEPTPGLWISQFTIIPEPSTHLLCIIALAIVGGWRTWKRAA